MKKLRKIKNIIEKRGLNHENYLNCPVLKRLGFKKCSTTGLQGTILVNPKKKIILKGNGLSGERLTKHRVQTIFVNQLLIQPLVNISNKARRKAYNFFDEKLNNNPRNYAYYDIHEHNVGTYRNKPVLIDW